MPRARVEIPCHAAGVRDHGRGGRASASAAGHVPDVLGYQTGVGDMTAVVATRPKRRIFAGSADQVRQARQFVGRVLEAFSFADDAILLVSELASNAVTHTESGRGGKFTVTVYRAGAWARVEVRDEGSATSPVVGTCDEADESGYGLGLVELLADRWGHGGSARGRVVWFELEAR
jgi:anti-sigma regulatory factor (Ser/Thr protein kinase)